MNSLKIIIINKLSDNYCLSKSYTKAHDKQVKVKYKYRNDLLLASVIIIIGSFI